MNVCMCVVSYPRVFNLQGAAASIDVCSVKSGLGFLSTLDGLKPEEGQLRIDTYTSINTNTHTHTHTTLPTHTHNTTPMTSSWIG